MTDAPPDPHSMIEGLREEPGYLTHLYNVKHNEEYRAAQPQKQPTQPAMPAPAPAPRPVRRVGRSGGIYIPPHKLR